MIIQAAPKSVANKAATWRGTSTVKQVPRTRSTNRIGGMRKIGKLPPGAPKFPPMTKPRPGVGGPMIPRPGGTNLGKLVKKSTGGNFTLSAAQKARVKAAATNRIAGK